jgi:DNA-binding LacI/PurR family transcriptional regulator
MMKLLYPMPTTEKPAPGRLKMADIAKLAGVSVSTVSRALAGSPLIPQAQREKIEAIARGQGYVVNAAARNLRTRTTQTIGVVLPIGHETGQIMTDPFLLEMVGHLSEEVIRRGYDILLTKISAPKEGWLNALIQSHRFDGLLMIGQSDQHAAIDIVARTYAPMVVWGERLPGQQYGTVGLDNVLGGRLATEHLLALGRTRVRFLGPATVPEVESRYRGYLQAMAESPHPAADTALIDCRFTHDAAYRTALDLLDAGKRFDALFCASDVIAGGARDALVERGKRIPEDVALCGFDDVVMARTMAPPLTTIRQDLAEAARAMVDMLFQRMKGETPPSVFIPARLIVRESTIGKG